MQTMGFPCPLPLSSFAVAYMFFCCVQFVFCFPFSFAFLGFFCARPTPYKPCCYHHDSVVLVGFLPCVPGGYWLVLVARQMPL